MSQPDPTPARATAIAIVVGCTATVLAAAITQHLAVLGVAFVDLKLHYFVVPVVVGVLFGSMIVRIRALAARERRLRAALEQRDRDITEMNRGLERAVLAKARELRAAEDQLAHAQKMEAVGRLAGGVAHDFNNLLTVMVTSTELIRSQLAADTEAFELAGDLLSTCDRATALVRQLLLFSRRDETHTSVVDLSAMVRGVLPLLQKLTRGQLEMHTELANEALVWCDKGQAEQVLMNFVLNAYDAAGEGGQVIIRTACGEAGSGSAPDVGPGGWVMLSVEDDGEGMDEETASRAFEPFFTTKEIGKGTGLGLSVAYGVVQRAGGEIAIDSSPGRGTTVRAYFPACAAAEVAEGEARRSGVVGLGEGVVLVVEDEDAVRGLVARLLERAGYEVLQADGAQAAKRIIDAEAARIDLLLSDIRLGGGGSGHDVAKALQVRSSRAGVLFMSGYVEAAGVPSAADSDARDDEVLAKPFRADDLLGRVALVMAGVARDPASEAQAPESASGA